MPMKSKAQNAAMRAAAAGRSTLGIPPKVGREFVKAAHGQKLGRLPVHEGSPFRLPKGRRVT